MPLFPKRKEAFSFGSLPYFRRSNN
jgi:hypothetical protein